MHPSTWAIRGGRPEAVNDPLNVPPVAASNFRLPGPDGPDRDKVYTRSEGTEVQTALETLVGGLDGGAGLAFSSGMAAAACVFNRLAVGSTIAIPTDPYHAVAALADEGEAQGRWSVTRIEPADTVGWMTALRNCELVWVETPANPLLDVSDLPAICAADRPPSTVLAVDSTFATPLVQRPLAMGADVVMHSATKFLGGHSDLMAGVLIVNDGQPELAESLYQRRLIDGGTIGSLDAFLSIRGIRTLELRVDRACRTAMILADRLEEDSRVGLVRYPGLATHPTHEHAAKFMERFGAMISFDVLGGGHAASVVASSTQIINHATSLGGVESTWERRSVIPGQERIPDGLIRFSVGCEHVDDLWGDIDQALSAAGQ